MPHLATRILNLGFNKRHVSSNHHRVKLNLGCGGDYRKGFINVDHSPLVECDRDVDLSRLPWPFFDDYADEIHMISILEHIGNVHGAIAEVHRILKPGGLFVCHVPYAKSDGAFQCPEHRSYFTEKSFDYFCDRSGYAGYTGPRFDCISVKLTTVHNTLKTRLRNLIPFRPLLRHFLWNMYDEVQFVMRKPLSRS